MSELRFSKDRRDADRFLRFLLRVHELRADAQTKVRRLLRILLFRIGRLSAEDKRFELLLSRPENARNIADLISRKPISFSVPSLSSHLPGLPCVPCILWFLL